MKQCLIRFLFVAFYGTSLAQTPFKFEEGHYPRIINNLDTLLNPFAGGFNNPQFSPFDFDFDGDNDIFVFDRNYNEIVLFENKLNLGKRNYTYVQNARRLFPEDVLYRATIVDYNKDGKGDLFTTGIGGVKIYKNSGNASVGLTWEVAKETLYTDYRGNQQILPVSASDIPAFVDMENDGDIDILAFDGSGQYVNYQQNQSQELYGHSDSLIFVLKNECWGKFTENLNNNSVTLNDPNVPCEFGNVDDPQRPVHSDSNYVETSTPKRHAGSTLLAIDLDGNNVKDLLLGDVSYNGILQLINGGSKPNTNSAMVSQAANFPPNTTPINLSLFPACFFLDIDFDNINDLLVAPNARNVSDNKNSVWYYKNKGTNSKPAFQFQEKNWLQKSMIDNGFGAVPVNYPINGKHDLVIANFNLFKTETSKVSNWMYYSNTILQSQSTFNLISENYQNVSTLGLGTRLIPTYGDLNNDQKIDLVLGTENGELFFMKNNGSTNNPNYSSPVKLMDKMNQPVKVNSFASPQLFDLNNDTKLDLVIGDKNGSISFYKNTGTATTPEFELITKTLGKVNAKGDGIDGFATPCFFKRNDTTYLICGNFEGRLLLYDQIDANPTVESSFNLISSNYLGINVGNYSAPLVVDSDNDGLKNLYIGTGLGGLLHFEENPNSTIGLHEKQLKPKWEIYPNPANSFWKIRSLDNEELKEVSITNVLGQLIFTSKNPENDYFNLELAPGTYWVNCVGTKNQQIIPLVVLKN